MAADFRGLQWAGDPTATAQSAAVSLGGFTLGHAYQVKSCAIDNTASAVWVLVLDDNHNARAVLLPASGSGPFTFQ